MDETAQFARFRLTRMLPRDPREPHRAASMLELFFDLVFVVAVSIASAELHQALADGQFQHAVVLYAMIFFAIWWAWMNFAWFATAFDTDDWLYRVTTFVQMAGVLVLAAGIPAAFEHGDFVIVVIGYIVMRVAMLAQWLRASHSAGALRVTALKYVVGIAIAQLLWIAFLFIPVSLQSAAFIVFVLVEISVPVFAERARSTPWHPQHITERYGSFTLIVLGEGILASARAVIEALDEAESLAPLIWIAALALIVTAALWWIYFWPRHHNAIASLAQTLRYGYTHYFVFASAAAFSAGIEVNIGVLTGNSTLTSAAAAFTVAVPIAVFLIGIWWIAIRGDADPVVNTTIPVGALLILVASLLPFSITFIAGILVVVVVVLVVRPPVGSQAARRPEVTV